MPNLLDVQTLLSRYAGAGNTFVDRLNLVRARYLQSGSFPGTKEQITLPIYSDKDGFSIVTLPRKFRTILAGAVTPQNSVCSGSPLGVKNEFEQFAVGGLGYGAMTRNFQEVTGRFAVYQEWTDPMRIRFKFEVSESAGSIYVSGTLSGEDVYALNGATWEKREKIAFSGLTAVTSTKYFDPDHFSIQKPVTTGRVTAYAVDDAGVETPIGVYEPSETVPKWRRYRVPVCADVSPLESSIPVTVTQFYTKTEFDAMFADAGTITVSADGTHDLVYAAYFLRYVKVVAAAGSGAYTHYFLLDSSTVKTGGVLRIALEIAASANPTLVFCNNLIGNVLQIITGDVSNAQYFTLVLEFNGVDWQYSGKEI